MTATPRATGPGLDRRKVWSLGFALVLHATVVVAWDLEALDRGSHARGTHANAQGAGQSAPVLWLMPPQRLASPPPADAPAIASEAAAGVDAAGSAAAAAAGEPSERLGQLVREGAPWVPGFPDLSLPERQVSVALLLSLDEQGRVTEALALGATPYDEVLQYAQDQVLRLTLTGAVSSAERRACVKLDFDADEGRVGWQLLPCPRSGAGRRP